MASRDRQERGRSRGKPAGNLSFHPKNNDCARLLQEKDWAGHPLGEPATWPGALREALSLVMSSGRPAMMFLGRDALRPL